MREVKTALSSLDRSYFELTRRSLKCIGAGSLQSMTEMSS